MTALEACVDDKKIKFCLAGSDARRPKVEGQFTYSKGMLSRGQEDSELMGRFK